MYRYITKALDTNRVRVTMYVDWWGDALDASIVHEYWAPTNGGYVRDITYHPGALGRQVCDGMASTGNTLYWNGSLPLVKLIQREMRRWARAVTSDK